MLLVYLVDKNNNVFNADKRVSSISGIPSVSYLLHWKTFPVAQCIWS